MSQAPLVTIASTMHLPDAAAIVRLLADAGIVAELTEERGAGGPLPGMEVAAGSGCRVRVAGVDAARARSFLERSSFAQLATIADERADRHDDGGDDRPLTKENYAEYAFRAAIFGCLLVPLQLYAAFVLLQMWSAPGDLTGRARRQAKVALVIVAGVFGLCVVILFTMWRGPPQPGPIDLREYPHPDSLWGTWIASYRDDEDGEVRVELQLHSNGRLRYQASGDYQAACTGLWGYRNHLLLFRFDEIKESRPLWQATRNQLQGWDTVKVDGERLVLRFGREETFASRAAPCASSRPAAKSQAWSPS